MPLFAFSGTVVLLGLAGLCLVTGLTIYILRLIVRNRVKTVQARRAVFNYQRPIHAIAFCVALSASLLAINWTVPDQAVTASPTTYEDLEIMETEIPITTTRRPPPPPPPPVVESIPEEFIEEDPATFIDQAITEEEVMAYPDPLPSPPNSAPAPAPAKPMELPPEPPAAEEPPLLFVEHMPTFGQDCRDLSGKERELCSDKALLNFIYQNVDYPARARNNGIEGTVVVSFVVEKDGSVSSIAPLREVGGGCTQAAVDALRAINERGRKFSPGIQNGAFVRVKFNIPLHFRLE